MSITPATAPIWQDIAADQWFDKPKRLVPALHVHGFWDQEDIYGSPAAYAALEKHDTDNDVNFFAAGPWYHDQQFAEGSHLGDIDFGQDTAKRFREDVLAPFFRRYLHGDTDVTIAPASVFETGTNRWRQFEQWPPAGKNARVFLQNSGELAFKPPGPGSSHTEFLSDPENPVPYAPRPNWAADYNNAPALAKWQRWLVEDQRFADGRPDVATWVSEPLK